MRIEPIVLAVVSAAASLFGQEHAAPTSGTKLFTRLSPEQTGVVFENRIEADHPMATLYEGGFLCGGVAAGDVDRDGRPDLYLVSGPGKNKLFLQRKTLVFEDATAAAGADGGDAWGAGAAMVDIDGDGDLDVYVCNYDAPNLLYVNDGTGRFIERAAKHGLAIVDACLMPSFCDYDRDGDLDVHIVTYRYYRKGGRPAENPMAFEDGKPYVLEKYRKYYSVVRKTEVGPGESPWGVHEYGRDDFLLQNDGKGRFTDVTKAAGMAGHGHGNSATWWDYDADGWPDLYVCNDFDDPDRLYRNNRDGTFTDVLASVVPHTTWFSMGSDAGDLNNDGRLDFFALDMSGTDHVKQKTTMGAMNVAKLAAVAGPPPQIMRNAALLATGAGRMFEIAFMAGLANSDWSWAAKLADLDNDGRVDVFVSNGMTRDFTHSDIKFDFSELTGQSHFDAYKHLPSRPEQNRAFRNAGDLRFEDASKAWGLDYYGISCGTALSDLDADGDLDMVVANLDAPVHVYRNDARGNWLTVTLKGKGANTHAIGATVRARSSATGTLIRHAFPVAGFASSNEPIVHFGLGGADRLDAVAVDWPDGTSGEIRDVAVNRRIVVRATDELKPATKEETVPKLFERSDALAAAKHEERIFDDFALQPLLPNRLSQLGPGLAWGDVDGDGDDDCYLGGAAGQAGTLLLADGKGGFAKKSVFEFVFDLQCEDMGALFFDADGDGDQDLYVVSGGVESEAPALLQDRLYRNDGSGKLHRAPAETLPAQADSGGPVAAADFDRDGDLDLFVGGRVIRGKYPLAPVSRLLRNDGGKFTDVTKPVAPELGRTGLVTAALWSDADNDGWIDLLVAHEWGPIKVFRNEGGKLADRTPESGFAEWTGWWNGIAAADVDRDGDIDYAVTNVGLNTKYIAAREKPALLYYGDFEGKGTMRLVEAQFEHGHLFPVRGKSCSTHAMPFLGARFKTYEAFAHADVGKIYTDDCLKSAHRFAATTLESGVMINNGKGGFTFRPLPRLAQVSPSFGAAFLDANDDGNPDLFLAQNFFTAQPETGRMDGGMGMLLIGRGNGEFYTAWPCDSGIVVPGDATAAVATDVDGNGRTDLVVAVNDGSTMCFTRTDVLPGKRVHVRLRGPRGNPTAVGARVTLQLDELRKQTAEVHAGGGYLSQSPAELTFGLGDRKPVSIHVRWPDGAETRIDAEPGKSRYALRR